MLTNFIKLIIAFTLFWSAGAYLGEAQLADTVDWSNLQEQRIDDKGIYRRSSVGKEIFISWNDIKGTLEQKQDFIRQSFGDNSLIIEPEGNLLNVKNETVRPSPINWLVKTAYATMFNLTGFETGVAGEFVSGGGTVSFQTATTSSGAYALRVNPATTGTGSMNMDGEDATGLGADFSSATTYVCFNFLYDVKPAAADEEILQIRSSAARKITLRLASTGHIKAYNAGLTILGTSTTALTKSQWYKVCADIGTSSLAPYNVYINGVNEITGSFSSTANSASVRVGKNANSNGQTVDFFFDNVQIADAALNDDAIVKIMTPDADGTYTAWTEGTPPSDYTTVDEIPASNADYVQSNMDFGAETENFISTATAGITAGAGEAVSVLATRMMNIGRERLEDTTVFQSRVRTYSTDYDNTGANMSITFTRNWILDEVNPNTSAAWTTAELDAVEFGSVEGTDIIELRNSSITIQVLYTTTTAPTAAKKGTILYFDDE